MGSSSFYIYPVIFFSLSLALTQYSLIFLHPFILFVAMVCFTRLNAHPTPSPSCLFVGVFYVSACLSRLGHLSVGGMRCTKNRIKDDTSVINVLMSKKDWRTYSKDTSQFGDNMYWGMRKMLCNSYLHTLCPRQSIHLYWLGA